MKKAPQTTNKALDYLVANLLDFFRDPRVAHLFFEAAKIALAQVSRMSAQKTKTLEKRYLFFASRLKDNLSPGSLRKFAQECLESAESLGIIDHFEEKDIKENPLSLQKKAQKELSSSLAQGYSEGSALERAANVLINIKREQDKSLYLQKLVNDHPLKDTLSVLRTTAKLPKEDIKNQLLKLKNRPTKARPENGVLFNVLKRAQAFSISNLHRLLGDELFFLCRPLGFLDQQSSIVIVEVPSSAHLHVLTYRKLEIVELLKKDPAFYALKNLQIKVKNSSF